MSAGSEFKKVLVRDNRLNVTDAIEFAVIKGAQNMTSFTSNANTLSNSSHTWNIQVPSETTIFDRRVLWRSSFILQITGQAPVVGMPIINYGVTDALSACPLHQLSTVMSCTINNNSVSSNMRDILPALLRMNDIRELQRYNGYAPVQYDIMGKYSDAVGTVFNPLGSFTNVGVDADYVPRGAWAIDCISTTLANAKAGTNEPSANIATAAATNQSMFIKFTVTEPLMISPFIWSHPKSNNQGMYGVQNMTFTFNMGDASRVWRSASGKLSAVSVAEYTSSALIFNFLSAHPSDLMPSRNTVPYMELPRFISTPGVSLPAAADAQSLGAATTVVSNAIQLNQIPSRLFIWLRNPASYTTPYTVGTEAYPDTFGVITAVSINFNNQAGILASASREDLFKYSCENGSNQSWYEFSGQASVPDVNGCGRKIPMSGTLLVLEFAKDINISDDFYSCGSLGNFQLQVTLTARNQFTVAYTPEVVIMTENDGCFVCERGTSSTYTGLLTKADVLSASEQPSYHYSDVERMVGGGFLDSLKSIVGRVLPILAPMAKRHLAKSDSPYGKAAAGALGALGYGKSGGKLADRMM